MTAILGLLRGFWKYLAIAAAGAAALFLYGRGERKKGATAERAKQNERVLDAKEKMDSVPEHSSSDIDDKLRSGKF